MSTIFQQLIQSFSLIVYYIFSFRDSIAHLQVSNSKVQEINQRVICFKLQESLSEIDQIFGLVHWVLFFSVCIQVILETSKNPENWTHRRIVRRYRLINPLFSKMGSIFTCTQLYLFKKAWKNKKCSGIEKHLLSSILFCYLSVHTVVRFQTPSTLRPANTSSDTPELRVQWFFILINSRMNVMFSFFFSLISFIFLVF